MCFYSQLLKFSYEVTGHEIIKIVTGPTFKTIPWDRASGIATH